MKKYSTYILNTIVQHKRRGNIIGRLVRAPRLSNPSATTNSGKMSSPYTPIVPRHSCRIRGLNATYVLLGRSDMIYHDTRHDRSTDSVSSARSSSTCSGGPHLGSSVSHSNRVPKKKKNYRKWVRPLHNPVRHCSVPRSIYVPGRNLNKHIEKIHRILRRWV